MRRKIIKIGSFEDPKNYETSFCQKAIKKECPKCMNFYKNLESLDPKQVTRKICPFGYTTIIFNNHFITSLIDSEKSLIRIRRRDIYNNKLSKTNYSLDDYSLLSNEQQKTIEKLIVLYDEYETIKPLLHDISNSISSFLDFEWKHNCTLTNNLLEGYKEINCKLIDLKSYKTRYLIIMNSSTNYDEIHKEFIVKIDSFKKKINYLYNESELFKDITDEEASFLSGFGLYNTLINYYSRISNQNSMDTTTNVHKPHKMLKKLQRMLSYKANKRQVNIEFTQQSNLNSKTINNISDIYIAFFSIMENAIKYAINNTTISIDIIDLENTVHVKISNKSEHIDIEEINNLTKLGYVGKNSIGKLTSSGYGCYLADQIFKKAKINYWNEYYEGNFVANVLLTNFN